MLTAKSRVYATADGKTLVGEGDDKASTLVAIEGTRLPESKLEKYSNVNSFFKSEKDAATHATAKKRVFVSKDGETLVDDGDENAVILLANEGQSVPLAKLEPFKNSKKYFGDSDPEPEAKEPAVKVNAAPLKRVVEEPVKAAPKRK